MKELCSTLEITHLKTSPYHPQIVVWNGGTVHLKLCLGRKKTDNMSGIGCSNFVVCL